MIFVQSTFAPVAALQMYANTGTQEALIDYFVVRNNDSATQTLSVYFVPSGGMTDGSNLRLAISLPAGTTYICAELVGDVLGNNDSIWMQASASSVIAVKVSGRLR